jgi:hypothetical protein
VEGLRSWQHAIDARFTFTESALLLLSPPFSDSLKALPVVTRTVNETRVYIPPGVCLSLFGWSLGGSPFSDVRSFRVWISTVGCTSFVLWNAFWVKADLRRSYIRRLMNLDRQIFHQRSRTLFQEVEIWDVRSLHLNETQPSDVHQRQSWTLLGKSNQIWYVTSTVLWKIWTVRCTSTRLNAFRVVESETLDPGSRESGPSDSHQRCWRLFG